MLSNARNMQLGIALSGGTLKATAHVGVLAALEDVGIRPDCIAGTSAGSFVAALHAHGYTANDMLRLIRHFPGTSLFDYGFPLLSSLVSASRYKFRHRKEPHIPSGLLRGDKLYKYFRRCFDGRNPTLPYYVIATDLITGKPIAYSNDDYGVERGIAQGDVDVAKSVRGSCSLPGVFTPVRTRDQILVDGAFRHYVPVDVLRQAGCKKIIAINLYRLQKDWKPKSIVHILARSYDILLEESIEDDIQGKDLVVLQPDVSHLSLSFQDMLDGVKAGREVVKSHKQRIISMLAGSSSGYDAVKPILRIQGAESNKKPPMTGGPNGRI